MPMPAPRFVPPPPKRGMVPGLASLGTQPAAATASKYIPGPFPPQRAPPAHIVLRQRLAVALSGSEDTKHLDVDTAIG
eukprot:4257994-Alexandrium_andersonii.AAC.1